MKSIIKNAAITLLLTIGLTVSAQTKQVNASKSTVAWVGKKITGQHSGTVGLKSGALIFKNNKLTGGTFTVDMSKLEVTDIPSGKGKENLEGHLKADDFFGTANYPTANLVFKTIKRKSNNLYTVVADLTVKNITNPVTFDIATTNSSASTTLKIDRTAYGIKYNSGNFFKDLGDKTINDIFDLQVSLVF